MEITFQCPTTNLKTVEIPEESLSELYGAIRNCFIHRLQTFGLPDFREFESTNGDHPSYPFETTLIQICEDCGVNWRSRLEVVAFFSSLLIGPASNGKEKVSIVVPPAETCNDNDSNSPDAANNQDQGGKTELNPSD